MEAESGRVWQRAEKERERIAKNRKRDRKRQTDRQNELE